MAAHRSITGRVWRRKVPNQRLAGKAARARRSKRGSAVARSQARRSIRALAPNRFKDSLADLAARALVGLVTPTASLPCQTSIDAKALASIARLAAVLLIVRRRYGACHVLAFYCAAPGNPRRNIEGESPLQGRTYSLR